MKIDLIIQTVFGMKFKLFQTNQILLKIFKNGLKEEKNKEMNYTVVVNNTVWTLKEMIQKE